MGKEGNSTKITIIDPHYKGRVNFLKQNYNYATQISHLKMEDAGSYEAEITIANITEPMKKLFTLHIHERLTEPKIIPGPKFIDNGTCLINLTCSVEQIRENASYSWMSKGQGANVYTSGPILTLIWKPGDHDLNYTCTARNPVSNSSRTILAKELCAGIEDGTHYFKVLYIVVPTILVFLFMLGLSFWHIQRKKEKEADVKDKEYYYDSISILSPDEAETTEYATVNSPKKKIQENLEVSNTLYATVQNTTKMDKSEILEKNPESLG
ncbi:SLAM family member 7-like [Gracilinanus agilis]|uniref:SLAM family member 7-like n=1 Tax=Gracilinanus agilis TaxID=191870 RepID=UPI001CFF2459|nr:SLAM family member 7-like [Gracilinanus agilis]